MKLESALWAALLSIAALGNSEEEAALLMAAGFINMMVKYKVTYQNPIYNLMFVDDVQDQERRTDW